MKKIKFEDKVALNPKGPHINQLWAEDVNEIKEVINYNADFHLNLPFKGAVDLFTATPTEPGVYLPKVAGTYLNLGSIVITMTNGFEAIAFDGTAFSLHKSTFDLTEYAKKTDLPIETNDGSYSKVDEEGNIAFKINDLGETSFNQNPQNLRDNLERAGIDISGGASGGDIINNIGEDGVLYFLDESGYIGSKIDKNGAFDTAILGNNTSELLKKTIRNYDADVVNNDLKDVNGIATYGQSLSVGQTEVVISSIQSNPNLLCFDGIVRTSNYDKSLTGDSYPTNRRIAFAPLVERVNDGVSSGLLRETPSTGTGEMFFKTYYETAFENLNKKVVVSSPGYGATTISQLSKGGSFYSQLIQDVTAGKNLAAAIGKSYRFLGVTWTQGESDYESGTTTATYTTLLNTLISDLNTDIKAITGQAENVIVVAYQLATGRNASALPNISLATFELSLTNPLLYIATPMYHFSYNDVYHLTALSSKLLGNYYGDVMARILLKKEDWKPLHVKSSVVVGNKIYLNYHVPFGDLVFENVNGNLLTNKGYKFSDNANIITSVSLGDDKKSVIIQCSVSPLGKKIQYACNATPISNATVSLGNLRDSHGLERNSIINNIIRPMHNWAVIQEIQL